jgi:hypothetical protein
VELKTAAKNFADKLKRSIISGFKKVIFVLPFIILAAAIFGIVFSGIRIVQVKSTQHTQTAADRWAGETGKRYRQVTLFAQGQTQPGGAPPLYIDAEKSINIATLTVIRESLNTIVESSATEANKKKDKKVSKEDTPKTAKLWTDAYSSEAKGNLIAVIGEIEAETAIEASITGVSGNYALFHPMEILSGSFLSEEVIDSQDIVINEQLAWNMFKSYEVNGLKIMIGSRVYTIVGVVRESASKTDLLAGSDKARAYIYFEELANLIPSSGPESDTLQMENNYSEGGEADPLTQDDLAIMCYEAVLPDQISGIAENDLISSVTSYSAKNLLIISNTGRFGLFRLAGDVFPVGENVAFESKFVYPTWELSAQIAESLLIFWWVILLTSVLLIPLTALCVYQTVRKFTQIRRV